MDIARLPFAKFDMVLVVVVADATETLYSERFEKLWIDKNSLVEFKVRIYINVELVVHFDVSKCLSPWEKGVFVHFEWIHDYVSTLLKILIKNTLWYNGHRQYTTFKMQCNAMNEYKNEALLDEYT